MKAVLNDVTHSVRGVCDDLVKYIEHIKQTDHLATAHRN